MADKIIIDFENDMITWDTDNQKGTEMCPGLAERKGQILAAMGYETVNISPVVKAVEDFVNGKIDKEGLFKEFDEFVKE